MGDCIFCKIIEHAGEAKIVFEDDSVIAFHDIRPKARVHILVVSKKHIPSLDNVEESDVTLLGTLLRRAASIAQEHGIALTGYKVITNVGDDGGQIIHHLHFHLVGGEPIRVVV